MNILLCSVTDITGGASRAAYRLLTGLKKAGVEARMLVMNKQSSDKSVLKVSDYYDKHNLIERAVRKILRNLLERQRNRKRTKFPNRENKFYPDLTFSALQNSLSKLNFDILHLHWVLGDFINFKDLQTIKGPIVWTIHDCLPFTGICYYFEKCEKYKTQCGMCPMLKSEVDNDLSTEVFLQKKKRYTSLNLHIVSPSNWLAKRARESKLLGSRPIYVIPNGIDTHKFMPINKKTARNALRINNNKKIILFGAISVSTGKRKGFGLLQSALKLLQELYKPDDLELLIFGSVSTDIEEKAYFKTTYLDYIQNDRLLVLAYSAADVMVVPSKYENLPNTIMESLSCGTPVAAFDIGGNADMIESKRNGYLAAPEDSDGLAKGISWCLENNEDNFLSKNARQKVLDNFRLELVSEKYISLYKSLLQ